MERNNLCEMYGIQTVLKIGDFMCLNLEDFIFSLWGDDKRLRKSVIVKVFSFYFIRKMFVEVKYDCGIRNTNLFRLLTSKRNNFHYPKTIKCLFLFAIRIVWCEKCSDSINRTGLNKYWNCLGKRSLFNTNDDIASSADHRN